MPYISHDERIQIEVAGDARTPGQLNYVFTLAIQDYITNMGLKYQTINDILGALEGAKMEFYRRVAIPYEDKKITENGDVY